MAPWIKRLSTYSQELQTIPLFGNAPPIDFATLALPFSIRIKSGKLQDARKTHPHMLAIQVDPIGAVFFSLSAADMSKIASWALHTSELSLPLEEGFYRYTALKTLAALQKTEPFQTLSLHLTDAPAPNEPVYSFDVELRHKDQSAWGRLEIPESFRQGWIQHFSSRPLDYVSTSMAKQIPLSLHVSRGTLVLTPSEFDSLREGDFVLFTETAPTLFFRSLPLFTVKLNKDHATIQKDAQPEETMTHSPSLKDLPLTLTVEVGRLTLTLDELMHLTVGNVLPLPTLTGESVTLTANGQPVATAELIHLDDHLGLRILTTS